MKLSIIRPSLSEEKFKELSKYLEEMWRRALNSRQGQVDADYAKWSKAYAGIPLETIRTVPYYKSSNFVVKLIRMFVDTFVARSLNIIFATRPLYDVEGLPRDLKDSWELYLNRKAIFHWNHYGLTRDIAFRGSKTGTAVIKCPWVRDSSYRVFQGGDQRVLESEFVRFEGPQSRVVPFEDFYIYPIEANHLSEAIIKFHKVRYPEETAREKLAAGEIALPDGESLDSLLRHPQDAKRIQEESDAHVSDSLYRELHLIECQLRYPIDNTGRYFDIVATLEETTLKMVDLYYDPYPGHAALYHEYKPLPREDFFYGESMCELLGSSQEEASVIHNDRRNNSFIANAVCFKRRSGSLLPNPSTNWYPGKVWDLDDLDDLEVFQVGRNYDDMLPQEDYTFMLAQKLSGISDVMQGASQGEMSKRGIYNTMGTLAVMQEGAQRQDTNIRDLRQVMSCIAFSSSVLQSNFGTDDLFIQTLEPSEQEIVKKVFQYLAESKGQYVRFEVKTSDAGANKEVEKANLLQMMQVIGQYGQAVQSFVGQLANPQLNPALRLAMNDIIKMMKWMATRVLRQFDEPEAAELLPDAGAAIEAAVPGGSRGTKDQIQGGAEAIPPAPSTQGPGGGVSKPLLESLSSMAPAPNGSIR